MLHVVPRVSTNFQKWGICTPHFQWWRRPWTQCIYPTWTFSWDGPLWPLSPSAAPFDCAQCTSILAILQQSPCTSIVISHTAEALVGATSSGADSIGHGGTCSPHFYKWLDTGSTVSIRTASKKLTKPYWPSRKCSPKRLIVLLEPKRCTDTTKKCPTTFKFVPALPATSTFPQ